MIMWEAPPLFLKRGGEGSLGVLAVAKSLGSGVGTATATAGTLLALGLFFLKAGHLVDSGSFDELVARNAAFRAMVDQLRFNDATDIAEVDRKLAANAD